MLRIDQALAAYAQHIEALEAEPVALDEALNRTLAGDVASTLPLPPLNQSAMDGYALRAADAAAASPAAPVSLPLAFAVPAGQSAPPLPEGLCARIFTGAPVPAGADAIEIQENVSTDGTTVSLSAPCAPGRHVRKQGEDVAAGQTILRAGTRLNAGAIALAAACGHARLPCRRRPRVAVLVTGDELIGAGQTRRPEQIFESNGVYLRHWLRGEAVERIHVEQLADDAATLAGRLAELLPGHELVVITGGASVGAHDHSRQAARQCGVKEVYWKVAQMPGKPLSFGLGPQGQPVFILPGNPASVFACAQVHLRAAVARLAGRMPPATVRGVLTDTAPASAERERLLRARVDLSDGQLRLTPLPGQASHMLANLPDTQALLRIPPGADLPTGAEVDAWLLSWLRP